MRILHSSDWHLGVRHGAVSREADHDLFLQWLGEAIRERAVDALIVAGDIFDSLQPPAEAQRRLFGFLASLPGSGLSQVVLVGGNHDSASRLDAPAAVLSALDVHVVGGIGATEESWERCLVPLKGRDGAVEAVCLAVPYVHEFRLGLRTTDLDQAATRAAFRDRFQALYRWLADAAEQRWPGRPLVATGHMNMGLPRDEDYPQAIHQVGQVEGLPPSILDPRVRYLALGHIHRSYPVGDDRRAWYSGSPVALSLPEAKTPRRVLLVDLPTSGHDPAAPVPVEVNPLLVPAPRELRELRGSPPALEAALPQLTWSTPLPPLLFLRVTADLLPTALGARLHEALSAFPEGRRPHIVEIRQERSTPIAAADELPRPSLETLRPQEVFATLLDARGVEDPAPLVAAFGQLMATRTEELLLLGPKPEAPSA